ncbi:tetratricopeptide repeat protein [Streptomyces sp. NBC_00433]
MLQPAPPPAAAPVAPAPRADGDLHVESRSGGVSVGRTQTFTYQAAAALTPVPLPHRIGRVPALAPHFQDRELAKTLIVQPGRPLILTGTTGTGKSQLAAQYAESAWEHGELKLLLWVADATRETITAAYARAAQDILGRSFDPAEGAQTLLNWLRPAGGTKPRPWLVVLDGVTEPADLSDGLWPPASPVGRVLVSSSRRDFDRAVDPLIVQVRSYRRQEAIAYLERALDHHRLSPASLAALPALSDRLGAVPASLALAVRHIAAEGIDVETYIQRLDDRSTGISAAHAPLRLTIDAANRRHPAGLAAPVLQLASVLSESGTPQQVLASAPALALLTRQRNGGGDAAVTAEDVTRAVRVLYDLSLVELQSLRSHTEVLVDATVRGDVLAALPDDLLVDLVRCAADALAAAWPDVEKDADLAAGLRDNTEALLNGLRGEVLLCDGIHPVALRVGLSSAEWGHLDKSEGYFRDLAGDAALLLGPDHPDVLNARACAARCRGERGDLQGATRELTEVLAAQQRFGRLRPDTLVTRHLLAVFASRMTNAAPDALTALADVLADRLRVLGPDHLDTLVSRVVLLADHLYVGRTKSTADARALLADVQRVAGADHRRTFEMRRLVSHACLLGGDHDEAGDLAAEVLADALRALGPEHPVTLDCRQWAAYLSIERGELDAAASELPGLLADQQQLLGPDHPSTLFTRSHLASCQQQSGDTEGALRSYVSLLADRRRVLGPEHPQTLDTLRVVANAHASANDPVSAVVALAELVASGSRVFGPDHELTLIARVSLGRCRGDAGDAVGAVIDLAAVIADLARVLGPYHQSSLLARRNLAWFRGIAGDAPGAVATLTELLSYRETLSGPDHPEAVITRGALAYWQSKAAEQRADSTRAPADVDPAR